MTRYVPDRSDSRWFPRLLAALAIVGLAACGGGGGGGGGSGSGGGTGLSSGPAAPTGVRAMAGNGKVTVSWTAVSGASSYNLYWGTASTETQASHQNGNTGFVSGSPVPSLSNGTKYYFTVTAVGTGGEGAGSTTISATPTPGATGALDTSFNTTGINTFAVPNPLYNNVSAVAQDSTGRIIAAGYSGNPTSSMTVWRVLSTGSNAGTLDTSFGGGNGYVTFSGASGGTVDQGFAVTVDSQDRIVVAGYSSDLSGNIYVTVWRLFGSGPNDSTLDTSFHGTGIYHSIGAAGGTNDIAYGVAVDASDNVIVTGRAVDNTGTYLHMIVWKLIGSGGSAGTLDSTFASGGIFEATGSCGGTVPNLRDWGFAVAVDGSGNIVVAGQSQAATNGMCFAVWRLLGSGVSAGSLDPSFNGSGFYGVTAISGSGGPDQANAIVIDAQGNPVVAGQGGSPTKTYLVVLRLKGSGVGAGTPDTSFNTTGVFTTTGTLSANNIDIGRGVALDGNGNIVVAGSSRDAFAVDEAIVWRILGSGGSAGTLDTSFASGFGSFAPPTTTFTIPSKTMGTLVDSQGNIVTGSGANTVPRNGTVWRVK